MELGFVRPPPLVPTLSLSLYASAKVALLQSGRSEGLPTYGGHKTEVRSCDAAELLRRLFRAASQAIAGWSLKVKLSFPGEGGGGDC